MHKTIKNYCKSIIQNHNNLLKKNKSIKSKFWDLPACASICHDGTYSNVTKGFSHSPKGVVWHTILKNRIETLGDIGYPSNIGESFIIGNCAEQHSGNAYMKKYHNNHLKALHFTETMRPRTKEIIPSCENCIYIFPNL